MIPIHPACPPDRDGDLSFTHLDVDTLRQLADHYDTFGDRRLLGMHAEFTRQIANRIEGRLGLSKRPKFTAADVDDIRTAAATIENDYRVHKPGREDQLAFVDRLKALADRIDADGP